MFTQIVKISTKCDKQLLKKQQHFCYDEHTQKGKTVSPSPFEREEVYKIQLNLLSNKTHNNGFNI